MLVPQVHVPVAAVVPTVVAAKLHPGLGVGETVLEGVGLVEIDARGEGVTDGVTEGLAPGLTLGDEDTVADRAVIGAGVGIGTQAEDTVPAVPRQVTTVQHVERF